MAKHRFLLGIFVIAAMSLVRDQSDRGAPTNNSARHTQYMTTPLSGTPTSQDTATFNMDESLSDMSFVLQASEKKAVRINRALSRLPQYAASSAINEDKSHSIPDTLTSNLLRDSLSNKSLTQNVQDTLRLNAPRDSLINEGPTQNPQDTASAGAVFGRPLSSPPLTAEFEMDPAKASHIFSGAYDGHIQQFADYQRRRGDLNKTIEDCREHPTKYNGRMVAWVYLIDKVKTIESPELKLMLVNGFFNTMINYDDHKEAKSNTPNIHWLQTPQQTLKCGRGVCGDMAVLKYETLMRVGFKSSHVRLLGLQGEDKKTGEIFLHLVPVVDYGNKQLVLNNQQASKGAMDKIESSHHLNSQQADWNFINGSLIETTQMAFSYRGQQDIVTNNGTCTPLLSFNEKPNAIYYLLAFGIPPERPLNDDLRTDEIAYLKKINSLLKLEHRYAELLSSCSSLAYENNAFHNQVKKSRPTKAPSTRRVARLAK